MSKRSATTYVEESPAANRPQRRLRRARSRASRGTPSLSTTCAWQSGQHGTWNGSPVSSWRTSPLGRPRSQGCFVRIDSVSGDDQPAAPGVGPHEIVHNGQTYTFDSEGFVLLASGRRDKRYKYPLGQHP